MQIKTYYLPTEMVGTYQEFLNIIEAKNSDGRVKHKLTASKVIIELIAEYVKNNKNNTKMVNAPSSAEVVESGVEETPDPQSDVMV
jgi:hypothetical protein